MFGGASARELKRFVFSWFDSSIFFGKFMGWMLNFWRLALASGLWFSVGRTVLQVLGFSTDKTIRNFVSFRSVV